MDISNSEVVSLGYNASEAYGLSWKVSVPSLSMLASVDVFGSVTGSTIHGNYFGVYTFGAYGMTISRNRVYSNIKYGLDPHDDSDSLIITSNSVYGNGNHGIICSQRCDKLRIARNISKNNVGHGIMLHRSVENSVVESNTLTGNSDSGIAVFESSNNIIRGNIIRGNAHGIRLSVGSSLNTFTRILVDRTASFGIYTYAGTDLPVRSNRINRRNIWTLNKVTKSRLKVLKLGATDGDRFTSNSFRGNPGAGFDLRGARNTTFSLNTTDRGIVLPARK